jgi:hypothetical protein
VNQADERRNRAAHCMGIAARVGDDVLREAYFQLAHHWRAMAARTESFEQIEELKASSRIHE